MTTTQRMPTKRFWMYIGVLVLSLAADLGSKEWALNALSTPAGDSGTPVCEPDSAGLLHMQRMRSDVVSILANHLELRYAENCGAAFGLMHKAPRIARLALFGATALGVTIGLMLMLYRGTRSDLFNWSVPLIVSGAIGNFADRLRHGFVVDFVRAYSGNWEWPTFNVADATISVGIALMLLEGFRSKDTEKSPSEEPAPSSDAPVD